MLCLFSKCMNDCSMKCFCYFTRHHFSVFMTAALKSEVRLWIAFLKWTLFTHFWRAVSSGR